jgi:hypothetical protein
MSCAVNTEDDIFVEVPLTTEEATPLDASQLIANALNTKIQSVDVEESTDDSDDPLCRQLSE